MVEVETQIRKPSRKILKRSVEFIRYNWKLDVPNFTQFTPNQCFYDRSERENASACWDSYCEVVPLALPPLATFQ